MGASPSVLSLGVPPFMLDVSTTHPWSLWPASAVAGRARRTIPAGLIRKPGHQHGRYPPQPVQWQPADDGR